MDSFKHRVFDPLDLEIIDHVFEAVWARVEASDPERDTNRDEERKEALRKWVFAVAKGHPVDFDTLFDKVVLSTPQPWVRPPKKPRGSPPPQIGA
jgi:hypothetical protein